jgi:hypothetical protein
MIRELQNKDRKYVQNVRNASELNPTRVFGGLRVRMGVHTAPAENLQQHFVTNRVIYPHHLIHTTFLVQDTACGGQVGAEPFYTK